MQAGLSDMQALVAVVDARSFTQAARRLGLPKSTLSRRVQALEERLGVALLRRTTRHLEPTEAGEEYVFHCRQILASVAEAERAIAEHSQAPRGRLRVALPTEMAVALFADWIADFLQLYPEIEIEVDTGFGLRDIDLLAERLDVALRLGPLPPSNLVTRKLGELRSGLYASPAYIDKVGLPESPASLVGYNCLMIGHLPLSSQEWRMNAGRQRQSVTVRGNTAVNNISMLRAMTLAGVGVALLPDLLVQSDLASGQLVRLLPEWEYEKTQVSLLFAQRELPVKTRLFVDFICQRLEDMRFNPEALADIRAVVAQRLPSPWRRSGV